MKKDLTLEELINHIREEERKEYKELLEMSVGDFPNDVKLTQTARWGALDDLLEFIEGEEQ